jgi:hypothetical protein
MMVSTGNADIDTVLDFIEHRGDLTSLDAVGAISIAMRFAVVPALVYATNRVGDKLSYGQKVTIIHCIGVALACLINFWSPHPSSLNVVIAVGLLASNASIGFHQTGKAAKQEENAIEAPIVDPAEDFIPEQRNEDQKFLDAVKEASI